MATDRTFDDMLNDYLPNSLLVEEAKDRMWFVKNVEMDNSWKTGPLIVPFLGSQASSAAFGALTADNDVAESDGVRGEITTCPELWFTLKFKHRDLMEHEKISEQNLLKILPDEIERGMDYMKTVASISFLNGKAFDKATADGDGSGNITVAHPERFELGQKVDIDDDNSSPVSGYVKTINRNTGALVIVTARGGSTGVDLSAYTVAQNTKFYFTGAQSNGFTSLKESLLPAANGGSSTLYGKTKTDYPYLQSIALDGSAVTSSTFIQDLFDAQVTIRQRGKGMPTTALLSLRNFGWAMTILEVNKGAFHIVPNSQKVSVYGWSEIEILGPKGQIKLVALQEMDDDYVPFLDMRALKLYSNGGFRKRVSPDGRSYYESRATTGYSYLVDLCMFGDFVLERPSYCGILYGIA